MSKHWLEGLAAYPHIAFLQSEDKEKNACSGTLHIHLMEQDEQGNTTATDALRYVKVSDSRGGEQIYEAAMQNGSAELTLEDVDAAQIVVVEVDEQGNQLMNGDAYDIQYEVNGEIQQEDYATHYFHTDAAIQEVVIVRRRKHAASLTIVKVLLDEYHTQCDFSKDMNFPVHIEGMGICKTVDLNACNHFQVCLDHLRPGTYQIYEEETASYRTSYRYDGKEVSCAPIAISLEEGEHVLDIVNTIRAGSVLTLDAYLRDQGGELIKPQSEDCYHIRVIGDYFDQVFTLDGENDFALDIFDLPSGCYDVTQLDKDIYDVTYFVNAQKESPYAQVEIRDCEAASVLIINNLRMCCEQDSPLRICKYVRRSDGCLVKPDPSQCFKVMLAGCGVCETFNLNASNNFCVDIEHICCGEYEIKELDHEGYVCSYSINDGCETTRACLCVHEGGRNCVNIINEERNKGEISICKVMRQANGDLIKPDKSERFLVTLRSFFCRETFVLDASNDFCVHVYNLKEGSYEVREHRFEGFDTTYVINGCKEERKARFLVENGCCNDIKIINSPQKEECGDLRICKYIANPFGDYVKPAADEEFIIQVQGPCIEGCYTLKAANNWCVILEGLKKGVYRIQEEATCEYTTCYYVNGKESEEALICMDGANQEVEIINTRKSFGNLKLSALIEDCDGCLTKPNASEYFEVLIESSCEAKTITLDACNNFCVLLEDMEKGKYRITQKDSYGYKVFYEIDGERMSSAMVSMEGANIAVAIINQMMSCSGLVRVRKWIETLDGQFVKPCVQDGFDFTLISRCLHHTYTLKKENDFCVFFDDLEEGTYEIKETCEGNNEVTYCINEKYQSDGCFQLGREDIVIDIINKELPKPILHVQKRIRENGCLIKPEPCESFVFILSGRGIHERYCLSCENDWCIAIEDLCNQHYEIKEIDQDCHTLYQINDRLSEQGYFLFEMEDMDITIINEERVDPCITIDKYVEDGQGGLCKPCREECFDIILEGECYKQCFHLDEENHWCLELHGIPCGTYRLHERSDVYCAQLMMEGKILADNCFTIGEEDVTLTLINKEACHNRLELYAFEQIDGEEQLPCPEQSLQVNVEHDGICDSFILNEENEFCIALEDICCGTYQIYSDEEDILYEANGECFENCIDVHMECGCRICVKLLARRCIANDITLMKRIRQKDGSLRKPGRNESYLIELHGAYEDCFTLDAENDWCVCLADYPSGIYEVREVDPMGKVQYQVDALPPVSQGYFTLSNQPVTMQIINQAEGGSPRLLVHAMVKNCEGELESAPADAAFEVMLDGFQVQEDVTLTNRNGFQRSYEQLPKGTYTITQIPNPSYTRVTYRVNGVEQPKGEICLTDEDIQVDIINYMDCDRGSIRIMKYIRDESCGCLKRPCMDEEYDIEITGEALHQIVVLNASNKWSYVFDHLEDGEYTIQEKNATGEVSYIVNGGKETSEARLRIKGAEANVKIINAPIVTSPKGSIEICKLMKDEEGRYHYPSGDESYWVSIIGEGKTQRILLHKANHFFVEVRHLEAGTYEVVEEDASHVLYAVNGAAEQTKGMVEVKGDKNSVNVINQSSKGGGLILSKTVQNAKGELHKPQNKESYRIHVSRPGFNQIITLDESNGYTHTLSNLDSGLYVIDELDHDGMSYIIDGGSQVDQAIVQVHQDTHEVIIINPDESAKGSMRLTKFIRNASGQLVRPSGMSSYQFHISKPGYHECITLNQENGWKQELKGLRDGNYVISEIDPSGDVSYIINDGSETDFGIINVYGNENVVQIINAAIPSEHGSITITKYIRNSDGELIRPSGNFETKVHVSRTGYNEVFTLNHTNNWEITLLNLLDGSYVIDEVDSQDDVAWRINGGYEVRYAIVDVAHNDNQVDMIDTIAQSAGSIQISKLVQNAQGQYVQPSQQEVFEVSILGPQKKSIILNAQNQWREKVSGLVDGVYEVIEQSANAYDVAYRVNDGKEVPRAMVQIKGNEQHVSIINAVKGSRNQLEITKYIKAANGSFLSPVDGDVFQIEIQGKDMRRIITLQKENNFSDHLNNLASGVYSIKEINQDMYTTTYRINGGQETNSAMLSISDGKNNVVEIINERKSDQNILDVYKYMMDRTGSFVKPQAHQIFRFLLTGNNYHQFYTLSAQNDWHAHIDTLANGEYEVIEQNASAYQVRYLVNGTDFSETAEFEAAAGRSNIVEIVNQEQAMATGTLHLEKKLRNAQGSLVIPGNGESFQVRITSNTNGYDNIFTLDALNGYALAIPNLELATYEVKETDSTDYDVTYIVNDGVEQTTASITIRSGEENDVLLINTQAVPVSLSKTDTIQTDTIQMDTGIHIVIE